MSKGIIFSIEEFAVHDGPGIRKTVFFKGCPLRCSWCHNPEGQSFNKELKITKISRGVCGREIDSKELAEELLKGKEILINSGGGITISGGEPLAQPEFLLDLIYELKPVHVAIETCGYAQPEVFKKVLECVDLILFDVKIVDPGIHKKFTGVDNILILKNLNTLCNSDREFYIRIPLIPGVNDTRENMEATAALIHNSKKLQFVELLPYHKFAGAKYGQLGRDYNPMFDINQTVRIYTDCFDKFDIRSRVL